MRAYVSDHGMVMDVNELEYKTTKFKCPQCGVELSIQTMIPTEEMKHIGGAFNRVNLYRVGYDLHLKCKCGAEWNETVYHTIKQQGMNAFLAPARDDKS
jgi:transcription elongation factor Elf1